MSIDSLVTSSGRLRILTALAAENQLVFVALKKKTGLTDGNLATHARRLQSAGLVAIHKAFTAGKPVTTLHLTREGREALAHHVKSITAAIEMQTAHHPQPLEPARIDADDSWVD